MFISNDQLLKIIIQDCHRKIVADSISHEVPTKNIRSRETMECFLNRGLLRCHAPHRLEK